MITLGISPYEVLLEEVEKGKVNPFEVNLEYLIEIFEEKAKELEEKEFFIEAGIFLTVATKLLKLKLKYLFPEQKKERKKITIEEVKEIVKEAEEEADFLDWLYDYSPTVGRPKGLKVQKPQKANFKEFFKKEVPLHKEVDWLEEAKRVYEEIKRGVFRIRSIRDFIAFLFAYQEFEDIEVLVNFFIMARKRGRNFKKMSLSLPRNTYYIFTILCCLLYESFFFQPLQNFLFFYF